MNGDHKRTVLVAGASGLVGSELLQLLVTDDTVGEIRVLLRKPLPAERKHPSIAEHLVDFDNLSSYRDLFTRIDHIYCALGTTIKTVGGSQEAFRKVDFDYPLAIARAARSQGAQHFLLVSALGADAHSRVFYSRVKGELEDAVRAVGYPSVTIARPSLLLGARKERRRGEEIAKLFGWLVPRRIKPVAARAVARALVDSARKNLPGVRILDNATLCSYGKRVGQRLS